MKDKKPKLKDLSTQELHKLSIKIAGELSAVKEELLHRQGYRLGKIGMKEYEQTVTRYPHEMNILDHGYSLNDKEEGSRILVGEPYGVSKDTLRTLIDDPAFINITANSLHFPGATLAIRFKSDKRTKKEVR